MITAPTPANERQRLAAVRSCEIVGTREDPEFDGLTSLAAGITGSPIATVSIVEEGREWFKAKVGIVDTEGPRATSFCGHAILLTEPMVIEDTRLDERFVDNPQVVGDSGIRFYAGAPLITRDGFALGTLCVKDRIPRTLTHKQLASLVGLAAQVVSQLELRRRIVRLERENRASKEATRHAAEGRERYWGLFHGAPVALIAVDEAGRVTDVNPAAEATFDLTRRALIGEELDSLTADGIELRIAAGERLAVVAAFAT